MRNISLFFKSVIKSLLVVAFLSLASSSYAQGDPAAGGALFKQKCTACHAIDRVVVGPALKGVNDRHSAEWLHKWIKNSQSLVASGDKEAVAVFNEYNKVAMSSFPELSDDDVNNLLAYFKAETEKPAAAAGAVGGAAGAETKEEGVSNFMLGGLILVVLIALLVIVVLNKAISSLEKLLLQKQGLLTEADLVEEGDKDRFAGLKLLIKNKKFVFFVILLLIISLGSWSWKEMWNTGVHTGYQPEQPIKFSHQLHAGINKIDCQYCHSGAYKSKNASIPSLNVCMNCHNYVQATEKYNGEISPEIAKIYNALDYNPTTKQYGPDKKPIQWVRIHNLPDFAYFNHSQHVNVAGIICQKCHGPIQTMQEVSQYSPLTMKWCINCHRETEVNHKNNAFYDKLIVAHEKLKKGEKLTAAVLGGTECAKCHY